LEGIVITASKPAMTMGIDKKVFNVDNMLTAKGGTAVDIMKNIPSVSVDVDGNVELRNSSPTIFVDGRPTILTLDQIASDDIDRIELITNPSAKYDASSSSGIINVILKKNKRNGLNGLVSITGGTPGLFRGNSNINLRQGKLNFFVSGNYNISRGVSKGNSYRQNKINGKPASLFDQNSRQIRTREFTSIRFGADYFIDGRNTITFSQGIVNGDFTNKESQTQRYFSISEVLEKSGERTSNGKFNFKRNNSQLNYTHKFPKEGRELNATVNMNYGSVADFSRISNNFYGPDASLIGENNVRNDGTNNSNQVTAKIDYENAPGEDKKIETGARSYFNNYKSNFNSFSDNDGKEVKLPLSNSYKYSEQIHAAYITYTGKLKGIGFQAGLRGEYSQFRGTLLDSAKQFGYEYPSKIKNVWDALFPGLYLSKKLNESEEFQLNYSRRIRRPGFWQLNPFIDINDPLNIQQGNPDLKPEFRNSFEFNYNKKFKNNSNFFGVIYYRNTMGDITRYSDTLTDIQYELLNNAAVDPNAILNTFINSKSNNSLGVELTLQQKFTPNFDVTPSASFAYRKVNADLGKVNLSNEGFNWSAKITANYKIVTSNDSSPFNKLGFQFSGQFESPRVFPQGRRLRRYGADFGMKKDMFKDNKGTLTFSINDVFNTQRWGTIYDTDTFYQETYRRGNGTSFRLTFSYKFGKGNFSLFKKKDANEDN
jgi:outer membrane receptor protein involved in Fe transport